MVDTNTDFLNDPEFNQYAAKTDDELEGDMLGATILAQFQQGHLRPDTAEFSDALDLLYEIADSNVIACFALGDILASLEGDGDGLAEGHPPIEQIYKNAIILGLPRLRDHGAPYRADEADERGIREILGMALTNVGARLANRGEQKEAVRYFRQSIHAFPFIPNTYSCIGRMGIYWSTESGVSAKEGVEAWRRSCEIEAIRPECAAPDGRYRKSVVDACDDIKSRYGEAAMLGWIKRVGRVATKSERWHVLPARKSIKDFDQPSVFTPGSAVADDFFEMLRPLLSKGSPLEVKVTVAASIIANLCLLDGAQSIDEDMLDDALETCSAVEPLYPLIGDDEWLDLGPPVTDYLQEPETYRSLLNKVRLVLNSFKADCGGVSARDAISGLLFKFDRQFRIGLCMMVRTCYGGKTDLSFGQLYTPGTYIGAVADDSETK